MLIQIQTAEICGFWFVVYIIIFIVEKINVWKIKIIINKNKPKALIRFLFRCI